jgi:hypothetical protein
LSKFFKRITRAAAIAAAVVAFGASASSLSDRVDSLSNSIDDLESRVRSTLMSGGSSPVSFTGEARLKMQYHNMGFGAPRFLEADRSYLASGAEGNENLFRLGMVVLPSRNTILWSKIGLQHTMSGNYMARQARDWEGNDMEPGFSHYQYRHDKARNSITIHEDMSAGIAVRTVPASFWVRMGNTMWTEASPLTVWKAQPRTFAWEYLPFEVEQPIARYYEYNIAKGEKSGRAAWNKKPFNGLNIESINLPYNLYANFVYGTFERYDNFQREYVDFAGDLAGADGGPTNVGFPQKSHGVGDSYRHVIHGRLAKGRMLGNMTLGLNYVGINYNDDIKFAYKGGDSRAYHLLTAFRGYDSIFYKEPKVFSVDLRGPINEKFSIHGDLALGVMDTVWMIDTVAARREAYAERLFRPEYYEYKEVSSSQFTPAAYLKLNYHGRLATELDLAYIHPGFYSPFSFATPIDAFHAFGSNMLGAGKFMARGEGSPYTQNMMGANITFNPKLAGYGHLRVKYGQHMNVTDEGRDLLFFPYRLHGADMFTFFQSSFNRWGNGLIDNSIKANPGSYMGRLGDESYGVMTSWTDNPVAVGNRVAGPGSGGLRSDFLAMYEGFVPYKDSKSAYLNWLSRHENMIYNRRNATQNGFLNGLSTINNEKLSYVRDSVVWSDYYMNDLGDYVRDTSEVIRLDSSGTTASWVPQSRKYTFNLELDAAYDIGGFFGYKKDLFVGGYAGINGITRSSPAALAFNEKGDNTLLWSFYLRLEPAIALSRNFYVLGLFGYENWRSNKSWMMVSKNDNGQVVGVLNPLMSNNNFDPGSRNRNPISERNFVPVPIDTRDIAYGLGFDWDMLSRVGLHGRVKWMTHADKGLNDMFDKWEKEGRGEETDGTSVFNRDNAGSNDWSTWVVSLELKTWF